MLNILCVFATFGIVFGGICESTYSGNCFTIHTGCPSYLPDMVYGFCGMGGICCYHDPNNGPITTTTLAPFNNDSCGITAPVNHNHRIWGGQQVTDPREFPWQVSLRYKGQHVCGGTILNNFHILTAAHCFNNKANDEPNWNVMVGVIDLLTADQSHVLPVESVTIHDHYNASVNLNDIAMVKLTKALDTSGAFPRTACLPDPADDFERQTCTVTGWGRTELTDGTALLRKVDIPIQLQAVCQHFLGADHVGDSQLCAGDLINGGKDSCQGDDGGPFVCQKDGAWVVVGVVSWGYGCGLPYVPGVYTRVSSFIDWINQTLTM